MHAGGRRPPPKPSSEARAGALPLLPPLSPGRGWGVGGNQSWLTVPLSVWSYDTCQVKKVNPLRQGQGAPEGGACLY